MDSIIRVWQEVPASIAANKRSQAAGLLVGLRDGSETIVFSALHCDQDELASTKGKPLSVWLPSRAATRCLCV
jgi:hypothetical protein